MVYSLTYFFDCKRRTRILFIQGQKRISLLSDFQNKLLYTLLCFLGCSKRLNALEPMSNTPERACWFGVHVRASESLKSHSSFHLEPLGSRPIADTATWETPL